jgi:hypothetical protein
VPRVGQVWEGCRKKGAKCGYRACAEKGKCIADPGAAVAARAA